MHENFKQLLTCTNLLQIQMHLLMFTNKFAPTFLSFSLSFCLFQKRLFSPILSSKRLSLNQLIKINRTKCKGTFFVWEMYCNWCYKAKTTNWIAGRSMWTLFKVISTLYFNIWNCNDISSYLEKGIQHIRNKQLKNTIFHSANKFL